MSDAPPTLHVLGSGSTGNGAVLDFVDGHGLARHVLIDLGLGPRTLVRRLADAGRSFDPEAVAAVVITHPDHDHLRPTWARTLAHRRWPVHGLPSQHPALARAGVPGDCLRPLPDGGRSVEVTAGLEVTAAVAPHDDHGTATIRFSIQTDTVPLRLGWATDLGRVTAPVMEILQGCDAIGIESNYDPELQAASPRPRFLKERITGGHGHLSNREAIEAILALAGQRVPDSITLLHLSRECNHPTLVRRLWEELASHLETRMRIADATEPLSAIPIRSGRPGPSAAKSVPVGTGAGAETPTLFR